MKFLFLIKSILSDWFTVHLKYTLIVLCAMIISVMSMYFISLKVANESFSDSFTLQYHKSLYGVETDKYIHSTTENVLLTSDVLDRYIDADMPSFYMYETDDTDDFYYCIAYLLKINGEPIEYTDPISGWCQPYIDLYANFVFDDTQKQYEELCQNSYEYEIVDGRYFTQEELKNHEPVIILPEKVWDSPLNVKVGDYVECGGYQLKVIGIANHVWCETSTYAFDRALIPYWLVDEYMRNTIENPPKENKALPMPDMENTDIYVPLLEIEAGTLHFAYEHPLTSAQKSRLAKALDVSTSDIYLSYESQITAEMRQYFLLSVTQCGAFGLLSVLGIVFVMWCLWQQNKHTMKIFRLYGAKSKHIIAINIALVVVLSLISAIVSLLLCPFTFTIYSHINNLYTWRFSDYFLAVGVMLVANLIALIPSVISLLRKTSIN